MKKTILLILSFYFIFLLSVSSCRKEEPRSGNGGHLYAQFLANMPHVPDPFTEDELNILNETLKIPDNDLPDFRVRHAPHSGMSSVFINSYVATVGRVLFYDKQLSADGTVSCASCHQQSLAFSDNKDFSDGVNGNQTLRNSIALGSFPSFSSTYPRLNDTTKHLLFWDERVETTSEQIISTFQNFNEMGVFMFPLINKIKLRPEYIILFNRLSKEGTVTESTVTFALETFMSSLNSQNSFLDRGLNEMGIDATIDEDINLFNDSQQLGRQLFSNNCMSCHGQTISSKIEIPFTSANNGLDEIYADFGIGGITYTSTDYGKFKIPLLRNIEVTGPYMHDGRFETLEEVIDFYSTGIQSHSNLHEELKDVDGNPKQFNFTSEEKQALIDFLKTMTDEILLTDPKFSDPFK